LYFRTDPCTSCQETTDALDRLAKEFAPRGVTVLPVDGRKERSAATAYMVEAYPSVVTIDAQGKVAGFIPGNVPEAQLRREINTALQGAQNRGPITLSAPIPRPTAAIDAGKATLAWDHVEGAESYVVEWDCKKADAWESDGTGGFVRVIPTRETSTLLELPAGVAVRWRVFAAGAFTQPGAKSAWQELASQ
jgi:thiol-disulfide isomerase/thioredoxin